MFPVRVYSLLIKRISPTVLQNHSAIDVDWRIVAVGGNVRPACGIYRIKYIVIGSDCAKKGR